MSKWQPIKTAPKDGTWVLLKGGVTNELNFPWEKREQDVNGSYRPVIAKYIDEKEDSYWTFAYWDSGWNSVYRNPTHWMSLPE